MSNDPPPPSYIHTKPPAESPVPPLSLGQPNPRTLQRKIREKKANRYIKHFGIEVDARLRSARQHWGGGLAGFDTFVSDTGAPTSENNSHKLTQGWPGSLLPKPSMGTNCASISILIFGAGRAETWDPLRAAECDVRAEEAERRHGCLPPDPARRVPASEEPRRHTQGPIPPCEISALGGANYPKFSFFAWLGYSGVCL